MPLLINHLQGLLLSYTTVVSTAGPLGKINQKRSAEYIAGDEILEDTAS